MGSSPHTCAANMVSFKNKDGNNQDKDKYKYKDKDKYKYETVEVHPDDGQLTSYLCCKYGES